MNLFIKIIRAGAVSCMLLGPASCLKVEQSPLQNIGPLMPELVPATVAAPTFSPPPGTYMPGGCTMPVTISSSTADATIYYTVDGSTPTEASVSVSNGGSVTVSTITLKAIAKKPGMVTSGVSSGGYTVQC